ncbi:Alkylglycerol monooxygenase [Holothuria leucospilota]|uniref:Alkylglycerol monooxygenase n=1 Tax=Holothuria leucospilota TaxID=206669 RepID=A0A9Q1BZL3_HOLLE|nr:Alkylglycerol monooxygenase [Holothuria leucospilota]
MDTLVKTDFLTGVRRLFYVVTPNETYAEHIEDVPKYINEAAVFFLVGIALEFIVGLLKEGKSVIRLSDGISSMTAGMFMVLTSTFLKGFDFPVYFWIYRMFPSVNMAWDSPVAWFICFFGVDLGYYWFHRMAHEVNFMWAAHQVHHSSEDYNLTTALRQSIVQRLTSWVFYIPLAPFLPPSTILVHSQFNTLYQFWIHTELIDRLGPLEYILNTPSHHRVHHGRNRYCIDKNYAGTLIIFDRMFGTFEAEKKSDRVVYGLVHPLASYDPMYTQFCHFEWMWQRFWEVKGISNKLSIIFKGPGWEPGKPRAGLIEDIPDIHFPQPKYDPILPLWGSIYIGVHFVLNFLVFHFYLETVPSLTAVPALIGMLHLLFSFTCVGAICDIKWYAPFMESFRCFLVLAGLTILDSQLTMLTNLSCMIFLGLRIIFLLSAFMWLPQCVQYTIKEKIMKQE